MYRLTLRVFLSSVLWLTMLLAGGAMAAEEQFRMITLQHRLASDLVPAIEPLVGPDGAVRAIDRHLLISASPNRFARIEEVIARLDSVRRNVRITVSHEADMLQEQRGGRVRGTIRLDDGMPSAPYDGMHLDIYDVHRQTSVSGSEFITVLDGERAYVRSGQIVPFTEQWLAWTRRYAVVRQTISYHEISTGFAVRPRHQGDRVELEITPRIAALNQSGYIDFEALSTTVSVRTGEWLDLDAVMQDRDEVSRAILAVDTQRGQRKSVLRVRVD
ncbi:MAG TPA: secretin N-terminal domain-containing protein [Methylophilaceae bacterium]|jgi:type II secretory pathway component GspD/PulD (secretin)